MLKFQNLIDIPVNLHGNSVLKSPAATIYIPPSIARLTRALYLLILY